MERTAAMLGLEGSLRAGAQVKTPDPFNFSSQIKTPDPFSFPAFQRVLAQACDSHIKIELEAINVEEKGSGVFS